MRCANCNRPLIEPAGYVAGLPVGPVCYVRLVPAARVARLMSAKPVKVRRAKVNAVDQPELWGECYFVQMGELHAQQLEKP
jgi:hypothetical protein